jgi:mRNA-degrading endonuclease RelE of RelBE toxin-antitoxin system
LAPFSSAGAFEIKFIQDAVKDVQALDGSIKQKLKKTLLKKIAADPLGYGTPLRADLVNFYKHEFAAHRIVYRIYLQKQLVVICAVGPRKSGDVSDIYNQLERLAKSGKLAAQIQAVLDLLPKS